MRRSASRIGLRIRLLRRARQMELEALASRVGLSKSGLSQIERGQVTNPGIATVLAIADALGVHIMALLDDEECRATIKRIQDEELAKVLGPDEGFSGAMIEVAAR